MAIIENFILGKKRPPPLEYRGFVLELNFEDENEILTSLSLDKLTFVLENADLLNEYREAGLSGGLGVYWGLDYKVKLHTQLLFDGYIDLTDKAEFSCEKVIVKVREKKKLDWMNRVADGFDFDLLYQLGIITQADFIKLPYILSEIPDFQKAALFFLYAYVIEREIERLIKDIINVTSDLAGYFSAIAGILKLIFLITYLILLIIAIIKLIKQMIAELIQAVKYHHGMLVKLHFEKACQYLGFTFVSSIFDENVATNNELPPGLWKNLCFEPKKNKEGFKRNQSTAQIGYYKGTFGDFLRAYMDMFHAHFNITDDKVFRFERSDFGSSTETYQIPDVRRKFFGINADELVSNTLVQFQDDNLDLNTINQYKGTNAKNFITSIVKDPEGDELIGGFQQVLFPFALGRAKKTLTRVEEFVKDFLTLVDKILKPIYKIANAMIEGVAKVVQAINTIIRVINKLLPKDKEIKELEVPSANLEQTSLADAISNRIDMMSLSSDFIGVPKLVLIEGSGWDVKIAQDNQTKLTAENLWNWYHYLDSFVPSPTRPAGNQAHIYEIETIPFCIEDYYKIRGINNQNQGPARILSPEGNPARIMSLKWNIWNNTAFIRYKEEKAFDLNLKQILIVDEGE